MNNKYLKHIPFISFLVLLTVLYIGNTHSAERKLFKIQQLKKELSETEYRFNEVSSQISIESTESELENKVKNLGLSSNKKVPIVLGDG